MHISLARLVWRAEDHKWHYSMQSAIVCGGDFGVDCVPCILLCDMLYHSTLVSGLVLWYHGMGLHHIVVAVVW